MKTDRLRRLLANEDLNFLLTNRLPRTTLTRLMGWFSRIRSPLLARVSIAIWRLFTDLDLSDLPQRRWSIARAVHLEHRIQAQHALKVRPPDQHDGNPARSRHHAGRLDSIPGVIRDARTRGSIPRAAHHHRRSLVRSVLLRPAVHSVFLAGCHT